MTSLENESIRTSNEEKINENVIEIVENLIRYDTMMRYILLRLFGFVHNRHEIENRNNNQLNELSFESFNENNNTIFGSTQLSIHESNNNSNVQFENVPSNSNLNNEEKNLSHELLICSEEKTENK